MDRPTTNLNGVGMDPLEPVLEDDDDDDNNMETYKLPKV